MTTIEPVLRDADALIIVPPFWSAGAAAYGPHVLQACAAARGLRVQVLYAGLSLAAEMGERGYASILEAMIGPGLGGERFFSNAAFGLPVMGRQRERFRETWERMTWAAGPRPSWPELLGQAAAASAWADRVAEAVASRRYPIVGCSVVSEQRSAAVALLRRIKALEPGTVTVVGGAACAGEMAAGIATLSPAIDYVFSGDGEEVFPRVVSGVLSGDPPAHRIVRARPLADLDALPPVTFDDYFAQLAHFLPEVPVGRTSIPFESSRGCWWGQKHHCRFCGMDLDGAPYRQKSPEVIVGELGRLSRAWPSARLRSVDAIIPRDYFRTVLPRLAVDQPGLRLFYEVKANLSLGDVVALRQAGVEAVQPGIEALSTPLLARMNKGVTAPQNIATLRFARAVGLGVSWSLLCRLPGDLADDYRETLALIPLLHHLPPPLGLSYMALDRFSPYREDPASFGLTGVRPHRDHQDVFPDDADLERLAYRFEAAYDSACTREPRLRADLEHAVDRWRRAWVGEAASPPVLHVTRLAAGLFLLRDTRGLEGSRSAQVIDAEQATAALAAAPRHDAAARWALDSRVAVRVDGRWVPLAVAAPDVMTGLASQARGTRTTPTGAHFCGGARDVARGFSPASAEASRQPE